MIEAEVLSAVSALVALAGTCVLVFKWARERYNKTLGSRHQLQDRINLLSCGVTIEYVDRLLGPPAMQWKGPCDTTQRAYWEKHAWVSVLATKDDFVGAVSVTITDPRFRFSLRQFTNGSLKVNLGRSAFSEAPKPDGWRFYQGSHNQEYVESFYAGNPTFFQTFFLGNSDAGTGDLDFRSLFSAKVPESCGYGFEANASATPDIPAIQTFRATQKPNTFAVIGPDLSSDLVRSWKPVGVHYERVRIFPMHPTEFRQRGRPRRWLRWEHSTSTTVQDKDDAEDGDVDAMLELSFKLFQRGDEEGAQKWLECAADAGNGYAAYELGSVALEQGYTAKAESLFRRAAENHFIQGYWEAERLLRERGDDAALEAWYRDRADAGLSDAMRDLGDMLWGRGEDAEAETWLRKAIDNAYNDEDSVDSDAMWSLGELLWDRGETAEAETWLRKAADGRIGANRDLGAHLADRGDYAEAKTFLRHAAENDDADAMAMLGKLLQARGDAEAALWLKKATDAGAV